MRLSRPARAVAGLVIVALLIGAASVAARTGTGLETRDGDTIVVTDALRDRGLTWDSAVAPADRAWIEEAMAAARPEAAALFAAVDGATTITTWTSTSDAEPLGVASSSPDGYEVAFDVRRLNGERALDRLVVVLHELGHVVDFALVDDALGRELDGGIPQGTAGCNLGAGHEEDCRAVPERFADTFAKWAARGAVSAVGAGYGIATPASLESWGTPLAVLSVTA